MRRSSVRSSTSSKYSRDDEESRNGARRSSSQSNRATGDRKQSLDERRSSIRSRYSRDARSTMYDEEKASFYENCKSIYLMVFDDTKDDITATEELMLCKRRGFTICHLNFHLQNHNILMYIKRFAEYSCALIFM